jgi:hypothetical protein
MEIRDLRIEPPDVSPPPDPTAGAAIRQECDPLFQNTFVVRNCWFRKVFDGVNLTQTGSATIAGCQFVDPKNAAILLEQKFLTAEGTPADVGVAYISECFFFDKDTASAAPFGVLATSGAAGIRLHHNYFIRFKNPVVIDLADGADQTALDIDGNARMGVQVEDPHKGAEGSRAQVCNNQINAGTMACLSSAAVHCPRTRAIAPRRDRRQRVQRRRGQDRVQPAPTAEVNNADL